MPQLQHPYPISFRIQKQTLEQFDILRRLKGFSRTTALNLIIQEWNKRFAREISEDKNLLSLFRQINHSINHSTGFKREEDSYEPMSPIFT